MTSTDWIDLLRMIPINQHKQLMIVTRAGLELNIELILRVDPEYLVFRGRMTGSTDEGRGFFFPFDEILCIYLNRTVQVQEMAEMFGDFEDVEIDEDATLDEGDLALAADAKAKSKLQMTSIPGLTTPLPPSRLSSNQKTPTSVPIVPIVPAPTPPQPAAAPAAAPPPEIPVRKGSILERLKAQRSSMNSRPR